MLVVACCGVVEGGDRRATVCATRQGVRHEQRVVVDSGLVVVPFAVPVAVPVATFVRPTVLYGYAGEYGGVMQGSHARQEGSYVESRSLDVADAFGESGMDSAERVLTERCANCHTAPEPAGGLSLFDREGALLERLPRQQVLESVETGEMPEEGERLSEEELEWLRAWARPPLDLQY